MNKQLTKNQQKSLIDVSFFKAQQYYEGLRELIFKRNDAQPNQDTLRSQLDSAELARQVYQNGYFQAIIDITNNPTMLGD